MSTPTRFTISALFSASAVSLALASAIAPAAAVSISYSDTTLGQPTWNRPVENTNAVPNTISGTATNTRFSFRGFTVDLSGSYNFLSTSLTPANWDNYTFLYNNSFSPTAPFTNVLIGNDDLLDTTGLSGFNGVNLTAGTNYFFVTTGFSNKDAGTFNNTINGPGNITLSAATPTSVPEPWTILGSLIGGGVVLRMRRKLSARSQQNHSQI